jgi:lysozyme family protein
MSNSGFEGFIDFTKKWEGVYSNDPKDVNGLETVIGISRVQHPTWEGWAVLDELKAKHNGRPSNDIVLQTMQGLAYGWYREHVWLKIKAKDLHPAIALFLADFTVNQGADRAIKALQEALRVTVDGVIGPITLQKASQTSPALLLERLAAIRMFRYMVLRKDLIETFGQGWSNRMINCLFTAQSLLKENK